MLLSVPDAGDTAPHSKEYANPNVQVLGWRSPVLGDLWGVDSAEPLPVLGGGVS